MFQRESRKIDELVALNLSIEEVDLNKIRSGNRTEFAYRMAWERTHAKARGEIVRVGTRLWKIVSKVEESKEI